MAQVVSMVVLVDCKVGVSRLGHSGTLWKIQKLSNMPRYQIYPAMQKYSDILWKFRNVLHKLYT